MNRSDLRIACACFGGAAPLLPGSLRASDRALPMRFELRVQGPPRFAATTARSLSRHQGRSPRTRHVIFSFAQNHNLNGATVVLDSDGGSVHGAIALGREIRKLKLTTTVGRLVDVPGGTLKSGARNALATKPTANRCAPSSCSGACAESVPAEARVMVHQIWLGDRREDPTAANYSAEDLVLVQRDIGRLAQYTADMGGDCRSARSGAAHSALGADARATRDELTAHASDDGNAERGGERDRCHLFAGAAPQPSRA